MPLAYLAWLTAAPCADAALRVAVAVLASGQYMRVGSNEAPPDVRPEGLPEPKDSAGVATRAP